jgi:hypothetical protein
LVWLIFNFYSLVISPNHKDWDKLGLCCRLSSFKLFIRPIFWETIFSLFLSKFNVYRFYNFEIWSPIYMSWLLWRSKLVRLLHSNKPSGKVVILQFDSLKNLSFCRHAIFSSIDAIWVSSIANYSKDVQSYRSADNYFRLNADITSLRSCLNPPIPLTDFKFLFLPIIMKIVLRVSHSMFGKLLALKGN